ncbi:membrane protein insertase YidC [Rapidithrix thailandica]|uniref:Membrane protein insertase YidC n=1 Tax=Rapidithrix thailandica TaxID=413964 RepID=A0AAW9SAT8_9BACT
MDKNQATGLILISLLLLGYMFFFSPDPESVQQTNSLPDSTTVAASPVKEPLVKDSTSVNRSLSDSVAVAQYGPFAKGMQGESKKVILENEDVKITFDSYGAQISEVILKNYVTYTKETLVLLDQWSSQISETLPTDHGNINLNELYYQVKEQGNTLSFRIYSEGGLALEKKFTLEEKGFVLNYDLNLDGIKNTLRGSSIRFNWVNHMKKLEQDLEQEMIRSTVNFYTIDDNWDDLSPSSKDKEEVKPELPVKWVSAKQKFFNSGLITDAQFSNVQLTTSVDETDKHSVKTSQILLDIPLDSIQAGTANLRFYFGPNDYKICEAVAPRYEKNVYLGWAGLSFINLYVMFPLFNFLESFISNYGVIIFVMVLLIKTLLFPLTYKSYISMAKMRVLKPELDEIKARVGDDMAKAQQEQMKLYQQMGVNPISGCIPMLAQMPVFIALFNFFPNAIQLRQKGFLWATDLSTYDSVFDLPFSIPAYGDHVSLFTLLMTGSTILYTYYNNQMSPSTGPGQGQMKMIGYITPVMFMFFLNSFSSGLTYYYFISNLITISQQLGIRKFIDEDKIRKKLEENKHRNKGRKRSKFQQRLEDALKAQEEAKNKRRK